MSSSPLHTALDRDGYLVVPAALTPNTVARLLRAFVDAPEQGEGTQHVRVDAGTPARDAWDALVNHAFITDAATHVLGTAAQLRSDVHGRNPLPGFGLQGLHADAMPRAPGAPFSVLTALWMLDAFTHDNGATRVVPGSHLFVRPIPKALAQPGAAHPHEVRAIGTAGSVLVMNGHVWHAGSRNMSNGPRRAVQMVLRTGRSLADLGDAS